MPEVRKAAITTGLVTSVLLQTLSIASDEGDVQIEVVNPMKRIFRGSEIAQQQNPEIAIWTARNEYENVQIALQSRRPVTLAKVEISPLVNEAAAGEKASPECSVRVPGYVYVERNTRATPADQLDGSAPGWYPDPLQDFAPFEFTGSRSIWLTCYTSKEVVPGAYRGDVRLTMAGVSTVMPIAVNVWNFSIPVTPTFYVTNWLHSGQLEKQYGVKFGSDRYWSLIEKVAEDMARHRQNVIFTRLGLVKISHRRDGTYSFDFSNYAKWVNIFKRHGFQLIEGGPLFHPKSFNITEKSTGKRRQFRKDDVKKFLASPDGREMLRRLLAALHEQNVRLHVADKYVQHVGDEAEREERSLYRGVAAIVREAMPGVAVIDATHLGDGEREGMMDLAVTNMANPQSSTDSDRGEKWGRWWYTAGFKPRGEMPNRFMDYPLYKIRMLGWLSWKYSMSGYLHYGYNWWQLPSGESPWEKTQYRNYAAGDGWIVYPPKDGAVMAPVSSMRWEIFRDGLEDYEAFALLERWARALEERESEGQGGRNRIMRTDLNELIEILSRKIKSKQSYPREHEEIDSLRRKAGELLSRMFASYGCDEEGAELCAGANGR